MQHQLMIMVTNLTIIIGLIFFVKSQNSAVLENINLSMNWKRITNNAMEAISQSKYCCSLEILNLEDCHITS